MMTKLFNQLTNSWAERFKFDKIIIKPDASEIIYEVFGKDGSAIGGKKKDAKDV
jgi:hypothetical protein